MTDPTDDLATYAVYQGVWPSAVRVWSGAAKDKPDALRQAMALQRGDAHVTLYAVREPVHAPGCWAWGPEHYACAVERVRASSEWQPIETAPKDGTRILVWLVHPGDDFCEEPFQRADIAHWMPRVRVPFEQSWQPAHWSTTWIGHPSHWMPLPEPPPPEPPMQEHAK